LAELYYSGTTCLFVLHGNVYDLVRTEQGTGAAYCSLSEFLATQVFGSWDIVLHYDLAGGLRALAGPDPARLQKMVRWLTSRWGEPAGWPRDPDRVLLTLELLIDRILVESDGPDRPHLAVLFDYAQYLVPAGDVEALSRGPSTHLVSFLGWAQNPYIKRANMAFCLLADKVSEVNERLVQSPHVATIHLPLPVAAERARFCSHQGAADAEKVAALSNGLSLLSLNVLLAQGRPDARAVDDKLFRSVKKSLIERQCRGLIEFVEPKHTLELVVGQEAAKERLSQDADLLLRGRSDSVPMGYLLCGPVGTGKTFLAEAYASSIKIPCVKLRNFRSKYVGETEGNLEQVLAVLRSLGPVVVVIDEADAALGNRESGGDSGTSNRVFSMIAAQMGDTSFRGRIVWMLLTSRPDLLPIDLKRQGRAEVHIPLFYPQSEQEVRGMFLAMARKNKIVLPEDALADLPTGRGLSGADIESVLIGAWRNALAAGRAQVGGADLKTALTDFLPSVQGLEKEMQELAAVLECTQLNFLPEEWRKRVTAPNGRTAVQERFVAIRQLLRD
jgi:AAA+ superfamily predicted ATPase